MNATSDADVLERLARWLRKHDCGAFTEDEDQERAAELVGRLAEATAREEADHA